LKTELIIGKDLKNMEDEHGLRFSDLEERSDGNDDSDCSFEDQDDSTDGKAPIAGLKHINEMKALFGKAYFIYVYIR
jgi:hypothetical protein